MMRVSRLTTKVLTSSGFSSLQTKSLQSTKTFSTIQVATRSFSTRLTDHNSKSSVYQVPKNETKGDNTGNNHESLSIEELPSTISLDDNNEKLSNTKNYLTLKFNQMVQSGQISFDKHQMKAIHELDRLRQDLMESDYSSKAHVSMNNNNPDSDDLYKTFTNLFSNMNTSLSPTKFTQTNGDHITGVYLHGNVGCGKTFCMDLFFESLPDYNKDTSSRYFTKQKVHFHKFMLQIHQQMHQAKMVDKVEGDPLPTVIRNTIRNGSIICFDEFQVTDVADALILRRLFTGLIQNGAIIVITSNRPPIDLYKNGIQRDLFVPFIRLLEEKLNVLSMWESETDYRLVQGQHKAQGVYFADTTGEIINEIGNHSSKQTSSHKTGESKNNTSKENFIRTFEKLTKNDQIISKTVTTSTGRRVSIPQASRSYDVAKFTFDDLCRKPMGAADYLAIGENFHTVFVENIPRLVLNEINVVRRFITFIDNMYECHVKLILHAETMPEQLLDVDSEAANAYDEFFAFDRTRSRLEEMGSEAYLKKQWKYKNLNKQ